MTPTDRTEPKDIELSPEDEARAEAAIDQADRDVPPTAKMGVMIPPWVLFDRKDDSYDILPAGRPGTVFSGVSLEIAQMLLELGNGNNSGAAIVIARKLFELQSTQMSAEDAARAEAVIVIAGELFDLRGALKSMRHDTEIAGAMAFLVGLEVPDPPLHSVAFSCAWEDGWEQAHKWIENGTEPLNSEIAEMVDGSSPTGAARIASERRRHRTEEGWTPGHDAQHTQGELGMSGLLRFPRPGLPSLVGSRREGAVGHVARVLAQLLGQAWRQTPAPPQCLLRPALHPGPSA